MKYLICCTILVLALMGQARAAEIPEDLRNALPEAAQDLLDEETDFSEGTISLVEQVSSLAGDVVRQRVRGAAAVLLVAVLCGAAEGAFHGIGGHQAAPLVSMAGVLSVTLVSAGSLDTLMGLGARTIQELSDFSKFLLPTLAAATAASGGVTTATFQQVTAVFLADLLMGLINGVLLPLVYLYIGLLAASAALPENRLAALAEALKKVVTWLLTVSLVAFTAYLSVARIVTGATDAATVKMTKAAISGVVPVVGGIIAEAADTVLAGAGMLKNTVGIFGTLAILAACAYPFLQLGVQYLLYKLTAFLTSLLGVPMLSKLIDGLGGVFGLVLGMTGSCAIVLLVSVLSSVAAVIP